MSGFSETVRKWATDDRRVGRLADADGVGEVGLGPRERGRSLAVRISLKRDGGRIADARFQVFGCGYLMAATAAASDLAVGKDLNDAFAIDAGTIEHALDGLPAERRYCAEIAARALRLALESVRDARGTAVSVMATDEEGPRISADDPIYAALTASPRPPGRSLEDRHLYACVLAAAAREPEGTAAALGLAEDELRELCGTYFPAVPCSAVIRPGTGTGAAADPEILEILLSHADNAGARRLARIIGARAAGSGHLWVAMGLFSRPELGAAIRRHLPSLAAANHKGMRWKKFLFKTVCDRTGAVLCKAPNCGVCCDYALCFAPEEG